MRRIYLGYFTETDDDKLHEAFDIDGEFMEVLAKGYLDPGAFEMYTKNDSSWFFDSYVALQNNFPFYVEMERLEKLNIDHIFGVFWVNYENDLACKQGKILTVVDDFYIEKFPWED
ncbi:hypothetical protein LU290_02075 [Moraxella nasibovis]|uniref:hypothetical protein n=1 Tax=Moraxella nasibovis TaxID=2904120 RepID=UPI00240F7A21|nr:hypothetical protein [Moraxella nasibovis]WFF39042.1 hypothetical protein LU290_02075 [Moraxella nasibovis]